MTGTQSISTLPCGAAEQTNPRIGVANARRNEYIPSANCGAQAVQAAEDIRLRVDHPARVRPEFQRMLDQLREGDVVVVWKLDRLARSTRDLLETMETIRDAGARFQSLSEPWVDTTTHAGKMIMTVFAGIAEFERDLIRERTKAGRDAARTRGVRFGCPQKLNPEQKLLAQRLIQERRAVREIATTFNVHPATIYRLSTFR
jgi:DNA invertase Pin-like site-specific DNA recombinase